MQQTKYLLLLGGNQGNERKLFTDAINEMETEIGSVVKQSSYYRSPAWGFESNDFINQAVILKSGLTPKEVLQAILQTEKKLGRTRMHQGYAARNIDIDILLAENHIIQSEELTIPHPRMHERKFALIPVYELDKNIKHPVYDKTIDELLAKCPDESEVSKV